MDRVLVLDYRKIKSLSSEISAKDYLNVIHGNSIDVECHLVFDGGFTGRSGMDQRATSYSF